MTHHSFEPIIMFFFESRKSLAPTPKATIASPSTPPPSSQPAPQQKYPLHFWPFVLPYAPVEATTCIFMPYFKKKGRMVPYRYRTVPYRDRVGTMHYERIGTIRVHYCIAVLRISRNPCSNSCHISRCKESYASASHRRQLIRYRTVRR